MVWFEKLDTTAMGRCAWHTSSHSCGPSTRRDDCSWGAPSPAVQLDRNSRPAVSKSESKWKCNAVGCMYRCNSKQIVSVLGLPTVSVVCLHDITLHVACLLFLFILTITHRTTIVDKPPIGSRFLGWTLDQQPIYAFPADCGFPQMGSRNCSLVDPIPMSLAATQGDATPEEPTSEMPRMSSKETSTEREVKFAASA